VSIPILLILSTSCSIYGKLQKISPTQPNVNQDLFN
jgi:hypothetical protein